MFEAIISGFAGLALGLYAGKKRVHGEDWAEIVVDLIECATLKIKKLSTAISERFIKRKERDNKDNPSK